MSSIQIFEDIRRLYGEPHFPSGRNPVGNLNETFWAALYRSEHVILFEPRENRFYEYDDSGIYHPVTAHVILDRIANRLREVAESSSVYPLLGQLTLARHIHGVIAHLRGQTQKEEAFTNHPRLIHVANGILDLNGESINLRSFSPELPSRNLIPIAYEKGTGCKLFKEKLLVLLDLDDQEMLQKFLGLFLLGRNIVQKILILHGVGRSSKSAFAELSKLLIGVENCSELRTSELANRFEIGSFVGKNLLIGADVPEKFLNTSSASRLKALVGGDLLDAEFKGVNFRFKMEGDKNVLVTSNSRMRTYLENDRDPWASRLALIEHEKKHGETIPDFAKKLIEEEGPGILYWAAEGLLKLFADVKECGALKMTQKQIDRVESLLDESDGLRIFLEEKVEQERLSSLTTTEIVAKFAEFCSGKGWNMGLRETERELPEAMFELFHVLKSNSVSSPSGTNVRGYWGVKFK